MAAVRLVRQAFGPPWPRTLLGAWLVLRTNQVWAPYPDNRPELARRYMCWFYQLLANSSAALPLDPARAAELEVHWWGVHHQLQHDQAPADPTLEPLVAALQAAYAYTYAVPADAVRLAAVERAEAMRLSDQWVRGGVDPASSLVAQERAALVRSYAALLAAVHR